LDQSCEFLLFCCAQIALLILCVDCEEMNRNAGVVEIVHDSRSASLSTMSPPNPNLAKAARPRDQVATGRLISDQIDDGVLLVSAEQAAGASPIASKLDHRDGAAHHWP